MRTSKAKRTPGRKTRYVCGGIMVQCGDGNAWTWSGRLYVWRWLRDKGRLERRESPAPAYAGWWTVVYPSDLTSAVRYSLAWENGYLSAMEGGGG